MNNLVQNEYDINMLYKSTFDRKKCRHQMYSIILCWIYNTHIMPYESLPMVYSVSPSTVKRIYRIKVDIRRKKTSTSAVDNTQ
jgi:hypothetical protein